MRKLSSIILSLVLVCALLCGCTYADNAKLMNIEQKYQSITLKYDSLYEGKYLLPSYESDKMIDVVYSTPSTEEERLFTLLKASTTVNDFTNNSNYGLLTYAVNSVYTNNYITLSSKANDEKVAQKTKTKMYKELESLEKSSKKLDNQKTILENMFEDDSRTSGKDIAKDYLVQENLKKYLDYLNVVLDDLLDFNNSSSVALNKISPQSALDEPNSSQTTYGNDISYLLVNATLLISNYIVEFDIECKNQFTDKNYSTDLLDLLREVLTLSSQTHTDNSNPSVYNNYKLIRYQENGVVNYEKLFLNATRNLTETDFENQNLSESKKADINLIANYKTELVNYLNNLISFVKNSI